MHQAILGRILPDLGNLSADLSSGLSADVSTGLIASVVEALVTASAGALSTTLGLILGLS